MYVLLCKTHYKVPVSHLNNCSFAILVLSRTKYSSSMKQKFKWKFSHQDFVLQTCISFCCKFMSFIGHSGLRVVEFEFTDLSLQVTIVGGIIVAGAKFTLNRPPYVQMWSSGPLKALGRETNVSTPKNYLSCLNKLLMMPS